MDKVGTAQGSLRYGERERWRCLGWMILILVPLLACACATSPPSIVRPVASSDNNNNPVSQSLRAEIDSWLGTPHHLGGMSRRGIDCSGLVVVVYDTLFDLQLPRTTAGLIQTGQRVDKNNLKGGDLVFFKPEYKSRHVGIYLGHGEFAHASTSRGVIISRLDEAFWRDCYVTGRRVR